MKVSVLMATYNGEKYIEEQLASLIKQERMFDELIIIDDNSSDETVNIVEKFKNVNHDINCKLIVNSENTGWKKNFMNGLKLCTGDVIFTCDQDDIWFPLKIKEMVDILEKRDEIILLASNYERFEQCKNKVKTTFMRNDGSIEKHPFDKKFLFIKRPGCVYAFRREIIKYIDEYTFDDYPHDAFLWRTAALLDGLYIYNRMTIRYRRHACTATGRERKTLNSKQETMIYYKNALDLIEKFADKKVKHESDKILIIKNCKKWCELRMKIVQKRSIIAWLQNVRYVQFYYNLKSYIADLYMIIRGY